MDSRGGVVMHKFLLIILMISLLGCGKKDEKQVVAPRLDTPIKKTIETDSVETSDVFKRKQTRGVVYMRHILVVFDRNSPRFMFAKSGEKIEKGFRTSADAKKRVAKILARIKKGDTFQALMKKYSDDPVSGPRGYLVLVEHDGTPTMAKKMALRLKLNETGVLKSINSYQIIMRVPPPALVKSPDSSEIMKRKSLTKKFSIKAIHLGWRLLKPIYQGGLSNKSLNRNQGQSAKLALDIVAQVAKGASFDKLAVKYSEKLPQEKDNHSHGFTVLTKQQHKHKKEKTAKHDDHKGHDHKGDDHKGDSHKGHKDGAKKESHATLEEKRHKRKAFYEKMTELNKLNELASRLKIKEVGIITSKYGYHILQRIK
jgi:PPIC-type PPIASE domain